MSWVSPVSRALLACRHALTRGLRSEPVGFDSAMLVGDSKLTMRDSNISGNKVFASMATTADTGPAGTTLELDGGGHISNTSITGNSTAVESAKGVAGNGGAGLAVLNFNNDPRLVTVSGGVIGGNSATARAPAGSATVQGVGVLNNSLLDLSGVRISGNHGQATGRAGVAQGGGIWNGVLVSGPPVKLALAHTAVTRNSVTGSKGITVQGGGLFTTTPVTLSQSRGPSGVDVEELIDNYPRLFHVAAAGSWPSIAAHGLIPTRDIVASSTLTDAERASVLTQPRPRPVLIDHPELGAMTLRDQSPLHRHILEAVLLDTTVPQWLAMLNDRIYFWLHPRRLTTLLQSRPNRDAKHDVLTIDTASLVADHHDQIRLSAINSGATQWPSAPPRGPKTFLTIEDYPFTERRRGRTLDNAIAELAVIGGVRDIAAHVVTVQRRHGLDVTAELPLTAAQPEQGGGSRA